MATETDTRDVSNGPGLDLAYIESAVAVWERDCRRHGANAGLRV